MIRRLLYRLTARLPVTVIHAEDGPDNATRSPLFERYFLCRLPGGGRAYLHHYLRSDPDRGLHDHPWDWAVAVPLAGGYFEERMDGFGLAGPRTVARRRRPFVPYRLMGGDFHRVITGQATNWSLFFHGPFTKAWGFLRPHQPLKRWRGRDTVGQAYQYHACNLRLTAPSTWWTTAPRGRDVARAAP